MSIIRHNGGFMENMHVCGTPIISKDSIPLSVFHFSLYYQVGLDLSKYCSIIALLDSMSFPHLILVPTRSQIHQYVCYMLVLAKKMCSIKQLVFSKSIEFICAFFSYTSPSLYVALVF